MIQKSQFKSAWWLPNRHLQTIVPMLLRHKAQLQTIDEILELPDGDFIELSWTQKPLAKQLKPIVIILTGLEGSKDSHYAKGMLNALKAQGWIGVLMHFRGCGKLDNKKVLGYHAGYTDDLDCLVTLIQQQHPNVPLAVIGFSLGGNVVTKFLSEHKRSPITAGIVISAPLNLAVCCKKINQGFSRIYQKNLLKLLIKQVREKIRRGFVPAIAEGMLDNIRTIHQFDEHITAPMSGFKNAEDYYNQCSGRQFLKNITIPTLVVHANNDPFLGQEAIPNLSELSKTVTFEASRSGGHLGYVAGWNPFKPQYWLERRAIEFLSQYMIIKCDKSL